LWHHVRIEVPDPEIERVVELVGQRAAHPFPPRAMIELAVRSAQDHYVLFDHGDQLDTLATSRQVLDAVFQRVHRRAFELASLLGWVRFHGAVVRLGSMRLVLAGPSGSGKTTLAAAILACGGEVEGDESFLTRDGHVLAVPRRWHVRPSTIELLPDGAWMRDAPLLDAAPPLHLVDPSEHGFAWSLLDGPVDGVVVLVAVDDAAPLVHRHLGGPDVVRSLLEESFPVVEPRAAVVRQASALARRTPGFVLEGHTPDPLDRLSTLAAWGRTR
jgi:hypothetical protein